MTYNVHSCRGSDRRLMPERILAVVRAGVPDVVALQEIDVGQTRSRGLDQAQFLAEGLGMTCHFAAARPCFGGHYGNAILTRLPSEVVKAAALPQVETCEPRIAQWVRVKSPFGAIDVLNAHFGVRKGEQRLQAATLLGDDWLGHRQLSARVVLCGDFNARPGSPAYQSLGGRLRDTQLERNGPTRATFPALWPLLRIDHVFIGSGLAASAIEVPASRLARLASDHRPLIVDLGPRDEVPG